MATIELLRAFALLKKRGDGRGIANTLGLSVSRVSRLLQELAESPYELVEKRGTTWVPTEKGNAIFPAVTRLLHGYDQLVGRLTSRETVAELLRVAAGTGLQCTPFPRALAAFRQRWPNVGVRVHVCRGRDRLMGVVRGAFDLALVSHDEDRIRAVCGEAEDLRIETLREQPLVVAAAAASADGKRLATCPANRPVDAATVAVLDLLGIDPQSNVGHQLNRVLIAAGIGLPPRSAVHPGGWLAALACARLGLGSAIVPADLITAPNPDLVVRPFLPEFRIVDRVVWCDNGGDDRVGDFVACLREGFGTSHT